MSDQERSTSPSTSHVTSSGLLQVTGHVIHDDDDDDDEDDGDDDDISRRAAGSAERPRRVTFTTEPCPATPAEHSSGGAGLAR